MLLRHRTYKNDFRPDRFIQKKNFWLKKGSGKGIINEASWLDCEKGERDKKTNKEKTKQKLTEEQKTH